jgi:hypothetical protein
MIPMIFCRKKHPINLVLLGLFTVCISLSVGLACLSRNASAHKHSFILTPNKLVDPACVIEEIRSSSALSSSPPYSSSSSSRSSGWVIVIDGRREIDHHNCRAHDALPYGFCRFCSRWARRGRWCTAAWRRWCSPVSSSTTPTTSSSATPTTGTCPRPSSSTSTSSTSSSPSSPCSKAATDETCSIWRLHTNALGPVLCSLDYYFYLDYRMQVCN